VRGFDPPETPYGPGHRGVDLAARPHAVVRAAGAGRVGFAGMLAGRGVVTVIHAGGLKTTYEPVTASVTAGTRVERGDVLGQLETGHPGCREAACLHWGLRRGEEYLDPLALVGAERVRLLPLGTPAAPVLPAAGSIGVAAGLLLVPLRRRRPDRSGGADEPRPGGPPERPDPPEPQKPPTPPDPPEPPDPPQPPAPAGCLELPDLHFRRRRVTGSDLRRAA
jgi:murein DD-endopeptidase MepM/ murein hydrolase activator NlpD